MAWRYRNPVQIEFGVDSFAKLPELIGKRRYALVTYGEPFFDGLTQRLSKDAGRRYWWFVTSHPIPIIAC